MKANVYNRLKLSVQIVLPAISLLYFVLSVFWDAPSPQGFMGIFALMALIGGIVLQFNPKQYDGDIVVSHNEQGGTLYSLELKGDPTDLDFMESVNFKIKRPS